MSAQAAMADRPVVVIGGPTASGKSALAVALAEHLGGEVINADSMQIYRDLPILTAQPDEATRARVPHRLYGVLDVAEACSAGYWLALAREAITAAHVAGRWPIVVGGTGLYLRALMGGLADIPQIPAALRAQLTDRLTAIGAPAFHGELAARDPQMAARLRPSDRQRMIRAAEVFEATGRSLADWQRDAQAGADVGGLSFRTILVDPPRAALYAACNARVLGMLDQGALDEAKRLAARRLDSALPGLKALGMAPLVSHLRGEIGLEGAVLLMQTATRHYAKRQVTWFRRQFIAQYTIKEQFSDHVGQNILSLIIRFLLTEDF